MFLNVDAGELENEPEELYSLAHVVNVACGGHAGDEATMRRVIALCNQFATSVGAHPSYPDRAGFGRVAMTMSAESLTETIAEQCHALASVAREENDATVAFLKLHGALYHAARDDAEIARAALRGAALALGWEITIIGPPAGAARDVAVELGLRYAREGFADRGMRADGSLIPRGEPGALIDDFTRAAEQARSLALAGSVDTVCVHGDGKNALAVARAVRAALGS